MMDDFKRARRIQGMLYEPLFDADLSQFETRALEEDSEDMKLGEDFEGKPEVIEDVWDDEFF